jgi:hypothetical protein
VKVTIKRKTQTATIKLSADEVDTLFSLFPSITDKHLNSHGREFLRALRNSDLDKHCDYCCNDGVRCTCEWIESVK